MSSSVQSTVKGFVSNSAIFLKFSYDSEHSELIPILFLQ